MQTNTNEDIIPTEQDTHIPLQEEPKTNKKALLTPIIVLLVLLLMAATAYATNYFTSLKNSEENLENEKLLTEEEVEEVQKIEIEEEKETVTTYSEYSGKYIQAEIPDGWEIVEYEDGEEKENEELTNSGLWVGLTGLSVFTDGGNEILQISSVDGIGGAVFCYDITTFDDTPQSYVDSLLIDFPDCVQDINHIKEGEYTNLSLLDYRGRRIGNKIYWNNLDNTNMNEFHPFPETPFSEFLDFKTLTFEHYEQTGNTYGVNINGNPDEAELLILDEIMSSIALK